VLEKDRAAPTVGRMLAARRAPANFATATAAKRIAADSRQMEHDGAGQKDWASRTVSDRSLMLPIRERMSSGISGLSIA